jgi:hypothetical protein
VHFEASAQDFPYPRTHALRIACLYHRSPGRGSVRGGVSATCTEGGGRGAGGFLSLCPIPAPRGHAPLGYCSVKMGHLDGNAGVDRCRPTPFSPSRSGSRRLDVRHLREAFQGTSARECSATRNGPFWLSARDTAKGSAPPSRRGVRRAQTIRSPGHSYRGQTGCQSVAVRSVSSDLKQVPCHARWRYR